MTNIVDLIAPSSFGWSSTIQTGAYDGLQFDCFVSTRDEIGRIADKQVMPNRSGQRIDDRAERARSGDIMAVFIEGDYPDTMNALIAKIRAGGVREFVHPIHGSMRALFEMASIQHDADDSIDSATMQIHWEEDNSVVSQGPAPVRTSGAALANAARSTALDVLNQITLYRAVADSAVASSQLAAANLASTIETTTTAATLASSAADTLDSNGDAMTALEIQATANGVLSACDSSVSALGSCETNGVALPEQYDLLAAVTAMAAAVQAQALAAAAGKPQLVSFNVDADISLLAWAHARYGDSARADEVLALNPGVADPLLIPAGTQLVAYAS